jgi:pyridoxamine 5'-phosphate oxidase family protein
VIFTEAERAFLAATPLGRIATASAKGTPDVAPVTFQVNEAEEIEIDGLDNPATLKWRNIAATGRAAFVVDDLASVDPWRPRGVKIRGEARADTDPGGRKVIRIRASVVWSWGINEGAEKHFGGMIERRAID